MRKTDPGERSSERRAWGRAGEWEAAERGRRSTSLSAGTKGDDAVVVVVEEEEKLPFDLIFLVGDFSDIALIR